MGRLIDQQEVIDCLTNTAKYYEQEGADEWTKGIHYGLLHGADNILDDVSPVEAIPKADYENRLKDDMVAMLEDLDLQIDELAAYNLEAAKVQRLIRDKIARLKENKGNE